MKLWIFKLHTPNRLNHSFYDSDHSSRQDMGEKTKRTQGWDMISPMAMRGPSSPASGGHIWDNSSRDTRCARKTFFSRTLWPGFQYRKRSMWQGMVAGMVARYGVDGLERGTWSAVIAALSQSVGANLHGVIGHGAGSLSLRVLATPSESCWVSDWISPMSLHL